MISTMPVLMIDSAECVECGQCRRFCPLPGAIIINQEYQHEIISPCTGCGLCVAFCPVPNAIKVRTAHQPLNIQRGRLKLLRRVVWRSTWYYHSHPLMGPLTLKARLTLRRQAYRARLAQKPKTLVAAV